MDYFYSKTTDGFYREDMHGGNIPPDAVSITKSHYQDLSDGRSMGKLIRLDNAGQPFLVDADKHIPTAEDHRAAIAARRWQAEVAGIEIGGMHIDTDDRSKTLITGSAIKAMRDPEYSLNWKTPDGFIQIPASQVLAMADAVSDHVQACFDREADLLDALANGTFTDAMLEEGWPNEPVPEPA